MEIFHYIFQKLCLLENFLISKYRKMKSLRLVLNIFGIAIAFSMSGTDGMKRHETTETSETTLPSLPSFVTPEVINAFEDWKVS